MSECDFNNDAMQCPACGVRANNKDTHKNCKGPNSATHAPDFGPGAEAILLTSEIGFEACSPCIIRAAEMNRRGAQGCRDTREEIIEWFREAERKAGWLAKWSKAPKAATIIPVRYWSDPIPWLVDESIRRAEAKSSAAQLSGL